MSATRSFVQQHIGDLRKMTPARRNEAICTATGCGSERARKVYRQESLRECAEHPVRLKASMSREDMLREHDSETKAVAAIRAALDKLTDDLIYKDHDFRVLFCDSVPVTPFKKAAARFRQNRFRIGAQLFWSTPATKEWALQTFAKASEV